MKNITQLRNELCQVFDELRDSKIRLPIAKELVNTAGKIINSAKVQLEYAALRKEVPVIEFLGGNNPSDEKERVA